MSKLIEEIQAMSPEERIELAAVLKGLEPKPEPEVKQMGTPFDMRPRDARGKLLTAEEAWDQENPLCIRPYSYSETYVNQFDNGRKKVKKYTKAEIDEYNAKQLKIWLKAKREVFPDCLEPEIDPDACKVYYRYR